MGAIELFLHLDYVRACSDTGCMMMVRNHADVSSVCVCGLDRWYHWLRPFFVLLSSGSMKAHQRLQKVVCTLPS